jgi:Mrp family chromosome partitioning ATPase
VLLGSARFREIMEKLTYEGTRPRIILDTPPLHAGADVDVLLDGVDGVLLVVRRGHTSTADVTRALRRIRPDKLIGIIFNAKVPM